MTMCTDPGPVGAAVRPAECPAERPAERPGVRTAARWSLVRAGLRVGLPGCLLAVAEGWRGDAGALAVGGCHAR
jgi:hypothetical protein